MEIIIIPTYNEAAGILSLLENLIALDLKTDILVVDNLSEDGTAQLVDTYRQNHPQVHLLSNPYKGGLALNYKTGFAWGIARDYTHFVQMDADGSHQPTDLSLILQRAHLSDQPDLVIGSRWVYGGSTRGWSKHRKILSQFGSKYAGTWLGIDIHDITAGFRVYKKEYLQSINIAQIDADGFYFQVEMTRLAVQNHARIAEVPICFVERTSGESKMNKKIIAEAFIKVTQKGIRHRMPQVKAIGKQTASWLEQKISLLKNKFKK